MIKGCFENKALKLSSKIKKYLDTTQLCLVLCKNWFKNL